MNIKVKIEFELNDELKNKTENDVTEKDLLGYFTQKFIKDYMNNDYELINSRSCIKENKFIYEGEFFKEIATITKDSVNECMAGVIQIKR